MYDPKSGTIYGKAHVGLQRSSEEILNPEEQQKWISEQIQVPRQTDGESCGYRMIYNIHKLCKHQELQTIEKEEIALEGCMIGSIKMTIRKQQNKQEGKKKGSAKSQKRATGRIYFH